eukprot:2490500-Rhodomonas_salina.1
MPFQPAKSLDEGIVGPSLGPDRSDPPDTARTTPPQKRWSQMRCVPHATQPSRRPSAASATETAHSAAPARRFQAGRKPWMQRARSLAHTCSRRGAN